MQLWDFGAVPRGGMTPRKRSATLGHDLGAVDEGRMSAALICGLSGRASCTANTLQIQTNDKTGARPGGTSMTTICTALQLACDWLRLLTPNEKRPQGGCLEPLPFCRLRST